MSSKPKPTPEASGDAKSAAAAAPAAEGKEGAATPAAPAKPQTKFGKFLAQAANSWQAPLLLLGTVGVAGALYYGLANPPQDDFDGALAQAEQLIEDGEF